MNTTLNINRIGLLLKRFFIENKQRELTFWGITIIIFMLMHQTESVAMFLYVTGFILLPVCSKLSVIPQAECIIY